MKRILCIAGLIGVFLFAGCGVLRYIDPDASVNIQVHFEADGLAHVEMRDLDGNILGVTDEDGVITLVDVAAGVVLTPFRFGYSFTPESVEVSGSAIQFTASVASLVKNFDFEVDTGAGQPADWSWVPSGATPETTTRGLTDATSAIGSNSFFINVPEAVYDSWSFWPQLRQNVSLPFEVSEPTYLRVRSWIKTEDISRSDGGNWVGVSVSATYLENGSELGNQRTDPRLDGTNDWALYESLGVVPAGTTDFRLALLLSMSPGTAWFDGIEFVEEGLVGNTVYRNTVENFDWIEHESVYSGEQQHETVEFTYDDSSAAAGWYSLRLHQADPVEPPKTRAWNYWRTTVNLDEVELEPGDVIDVSGWIKTEDLIDYNQISGHPGGATITVMFFNEAYSQVGSTINVLDVPVTGTNDWEYYVKTGIEIPDDTYRMQIRCRQILSLGTAWWDDIRIELCSN